MIDYFLEKMQENPTHQAIAASDFSATYNEIIDRYNFFTECGLLLI